MHYMLKQEAKIDNGGPSWLEGDTLFFIVAGRYVVVLDHYSLMACLLIYMYWQRALG